MTRVFIDGGHGTTGLEIRERLDGRPEFTLVEIAEAHRKDANARRDALNSADVAILCLPDDAAREAVALVDSNCTRIIDASTAYRVASGWTYGFPEIGFDVAAATRVSNPGCYPTGFLALMTPLVRAGLLPGDWPYSVNAVSGYSGGGKAMIAEFDPSTRSGGAAATAWRTYALGLAHKHVPEMQVHAGLAHPPIFAPSVANLHRGMIVDVPVPLAAIPGAGSVAQIRECLRDAYAHTRLVNVVDGFDDANLTIERCAGTDRLDLFVFANAAGDQIRLVAALDNLGKGAGGACVQSLNLMAGLDETAGLRV